MPATPPTKTRSSKPSPKAVRAIERRIEREETSMLRRKAALARLRRRLPRREVPDYVFVRTDGRRTSLAELFGEKDDLIVVHHMGARCPYCALWADGYEGVRRHLEQRAAFVVASPDPAPVLRALAKRRAWRFRFVSSHGTAFFRDMGFEGKNGSPWPGVSTFRREKDGRMYRVASRPFGPGDDFCSAWHFLDLPADGPGGLEPIR